MEALYVPLIMRGRIAVCTLIAALKKGISPGGRAGYILWGDLGILALEPLISALGDNDVATRQGAAKALGMIRDVKAIEPLEKLAQNDQDLTVRNVARDAVAEIRSHTAKANL